MTSTYDVAFADLQEQPVARVRGTISFEEIPVFLGAAFGEIERVGSRQGLRLTGPPYARYRLTEEGSVGVEAGFPVSGAVDATGSVEPGVLPGGHVAITVHVGTCDDIDAAYQALESSVVGHGYEPTGPAWEAYLDEPAAAAPRTRVFMPCRRVRPGSGCAT